MVLKIVMTNRGTFQVKKKIPFLPIYLPAETSYTCVGSWYHPTYATLEKAEKRAEEMMKEYFAEKERKKNIQLMKKSFSELKYCSDCKGIDT